MKTVSILFIFKLGALALAKENCVSHSRAFEHQIRLLMRVAFSQCEHLRQILSARVTYPGEASYNNTENSYWSLQETEIEPACIVQPSTAQDVAQTVSAISRVKECRFAIKGHGHNPAAGFANVVGGVTIDMTYMASIEVNAEHSVAHVGAGASWLDDTDIWIRMAWPSPAVATGMLVSEVCC